MLRSPCTICTDLLTAEDLVACPCGHVYHDHCLATWFGRSRTCPTCRKDCASCIKLYFSEVQESASQDDIVAVKNKLRQTTALLHEKEERLKDVFKTMDDMNAKFEEQKHTLSEYTMLVEKEKSVNESLKQQIEYLKDKTKHFKLLEKKVAVLKANLEKLDRFEKILNGTHEEAEEMLRNIGNGSKTASELASQLIIMKKENGKMRESKKKASEEKAQLERNYNSLNHKLKTKEIECGKLNKEIENLQDTLKETEQERQNLKKKIDKMQQSFDTASPRGTLINRLLQESPAPLKLDESIIVSSDTDENVGSLEDNNVMRIPPPKKSKPAFVSPVHPGALQKSRKRSYISLENPGRLSTGYNGLGGHSTVLLPSQAKKVKKVSKPATISKFVRTQVNPPLPSWKL